MAKAGGGASSTGIRGRITVSDPANTAVLQRDTDVAFGTAVTIQQFSSGSFIYDWEDALPLDGVDYYYRYREERTGYGVSSWATSTPTSGQPITFGGAA